MALPDSITTVTVTGTYLTPDGEPASGSVSFTPSITAAVAGAILPAAPYTVALDGDGRVSVGLAATDDPDWEAAGFTYTVTERIGGARTRSYSISVPADSPDGELDLATVAPVVAATEVTPYLLAGANLSDVEDEAEARSNLGLPEPPYLMPGNDLGDVDDPATARSNLGIVDDGVWVDITPAENVQHSDVARAQVRLINSGTSAELSGRLQATAQVLGGTTLGVIPDDYAPVHELKLSGRSAGSGATGNTITIGENGVIEFGAAINSGSYLPLDSITYRTV